MKLNAITFTLLVALFACNNKKEPEKKSEDSTQQVEKNTIKTPIDSIVNLIEEAHLKKLVDQKKAIQFNMELRFGGKLRYNGVITVSPNADRIKMQDSSTVMVWDGKKAIIAPDTVDEKGARFALFTWPYFFSAPYKLSDPGTNHEFMGKMPLNNKKYAATKLTFDENIGDSPNDWYILYKDNDSDLLAAMAYIVTAGSTSKENAEKDPHVITYEAYTEIEGIPFATVWNFWTWNKEGEMKKLLGNANLSNIKFISTNESTFTTERSSKPLAL